jgi:hypothetical protein
MSFGGVSDLARAAIFQDWLKMPAKRKCKIIEKSAPASDVGRMAALARGVAVRHT